jgi:hypothetical protein
MSAPTPEAVDAALTPLRTQLEADGYGLDVALADQRIDLRFLVTEDDACGECLVPRTIMEPMVTKMLQDGGVDAELVVHYPAGHIDA